MLTPVKISLAQDEQFTLFVRAYELYEMLNDSFRPPSERAAIEADFFRCARKLREHRLNFWKFGVPCAR